MLKHLSVQHELKFQKWHVFDPTHKCQCFPTRQHVHYQEKISVFLTGQWINTAVFLTLAPCTQTANRLSLQIPLRLPASKSLFTLILPCLNIVRQAFNT